jgi:hypothetical protein
VSQQFQVRGQVERSEVSSTSYFKYVSVKKVKYKLSDLSIKNTCLYNMSKILIHRLFFHRIAKPLRQFSTDKSSNQANVNDANIVSSSCKDVSIPKQQIDQVSMFQNISFFVTVCQLKYLAMESYSA